MKTKILFLLCVMVAMGSVTVQAQTPTEGEKSEKTKPDFLPEAGSFGIGADASPLFNYIGNMFNNTVGNTLNLTNPVIYGKYYLTDMNAIRVVVGLNNSTTKEMKYARDDAAWFADPLSNKEVVDSKRTNINDYLASVAMQYFVGKNKLRGFYGYQILGGKASSKWMYKYGNPMSSLNPTPSAAYPYTPSGSRLLETINYSNLYVGLGGIAGFEYYIVPRLCVGGEASINFLYTRSKQIYTKSEEMNGTKVANVEKAISPGGNQFSVETVSFSPGHIQNLGFYVMFHF